MPTRLQLARNEILENLDQNPIRVHKPRELERILAENRERWRLAKSMPFGEFLKYLLKSKKLRRLEFPFPHRNEVLGRQSRAEELSFLTRPGSSF